MEVRKKEELIQELAALRRKVAELEAARDASSEVLALKMGQLAALSQAAHLLSACLELDRVLAEIISLAGTVVPSDYSGVVLVDGAGRPSQNAENLPGMPALQCRIRDAGFTHWIIHSRRAIIIDDIGPDGAVTPDPGEGAPRYANPHLVEAGVKALAGLPLLVKDQLAGVLFLHSRRAGAFHDEALLLTAFAKQAALAIENARLYEAIRQELDERKRAEEGLRQRNRELALLNQIIAVSATMQEPKVVLETVCRELAGAFNVPQTIAVLLNEQRTEAEVVAEYTAAGSAQTAVGRVVSVNGNSIFNYMLSCRGPLAVNDALNDLRLDAMRDLACQRDVASALFIPLVVEDRVLGSLCLVALQPRHFSPQEISLAWSVADQVAGALARTQLAQARQRLITAIEQTADSVIITDTQGTILYVNRGFEEASGYSRIEMVGRDVRAMANGKHDAAFFDGMWATVGTGQVWRGRFIHRKKDGSLYTEDASITPVLDERGAVVSRVAVQRDVTRQLQLEEQYRQAQKMEMTGRLTAGIAHDFNNLLTGINGFAELARLELTADDPLREALDKVLNSGLRATELVRQLMAFSRKRPIDPEVLSLNAVVADVDKLLRRVIGEHIALRTVLAPDLWPVKADRAQIEQVIVNLAVNARDAMPGGGHLTIETGNVVLDEDYAACHFDVPPGQYAVLAVSDDGIGMSGEVKVHLFEPFFTTKEPGKGTGLGLATVFGIVRGSGGHVGCYSEEGQGTTIRVYLPRVLGVARSAARHDEAGDLPRGSEAILVAEDDASVRELAVRVLRQQGYTVLEAAGGAEALRLARECRQPVHLLLTDVVMPGLGGETLAEQVAQVCPGLKVLFMSGYTDDAISHRGVLKPGVSFLQKPFGPPALARKVRAVLDAN
jgi:PAS domain S-box-containing protein